MPLRPAGTNPLKPIREGEDPFTTVLNPFNGISSLTGPVRGTLVGRKGMSKELAILTKNGTVKPTLGEALDTKILPFTEFCRDAKPDTWGVIRIKNVSPSASPPIYFLSF